MKYIESLNHIILKYHFKLLLNKYQHMQHGTHTYVHIKTPIVFSKHIILQYNTFLEHTSSIVVAEKRKSNDIEQLGLFIYISVCVK